MPAKKNMNVTQVDMKTNVDTTPVVSVAPVVVPAEKKQRGGKKPVLPVETPLDATVATPVVAKKRGGAKKAPVDVNASVTDAPVVDVPVTDAPVVAKKQRGGAKKLPVVETEVKQTDAPKTKRKTAAKTESKVDAPKKQRKNLKALESTTTDGPVVDEQTLDVEGEKHIRSFKVRLPGSEQFEGRFTGLTPYQAANKALSKYFREGEKSAGEVTFSICESTRKSKKAVYTYIGQRHKLADPVKYTIQDGREIVKNFKNSLKKVKKTDQQELAPTASA